jgi:hypothetical protein
LGITVGPVKVFGGGAHMDCARAVVIRMSQKRAEPHTHLEVLCLRLLI